MPFLHHALDQRLEATVGQEITGQKERTLAFVLPQFLKNNLPAFGIFVPGENDSQPPGRCRTPDDSAFSQLHVSPSRTLARALPVHRRLPGPAQRTEHSESRHRPK